MTRLEEGLAIPVHHLFLQPTEEKAVACPCDRLFLIRALCGFTVRRDLFPHSNGNVLVLLEKILVQKKEEPPESIFTTAMGSCSQEKEMIGFVRQSFYCFVTLAFI